MKNSPTTGLKTDSPNQPELNTLAGHNILFVMADKAEYGPHLQQRFTPLMTARSGRGGGAADGGACRSGPACSLPDLVVSLLTAGCSADRGLSGDSVATVTWMPAPWLREGCHAILSLPAICPAAAYSGAPGHAVYWRHIVSGVGYDAIAAEMVNGNLRLSAGLHEFDVPLTALRGISDGKVDLHHVDD